MRPIIAYYGDDFTGSTDVMEILQWAGLRTVLFLEPPNPEQLRAFDNLRVFGIAGWSRTMSPQEMDLELKPALQSLRDSEASFIHYKTCSTFDSSPNIGSIGKALELGRDVCGASCVPILIAAPHLGRYQAFGNLFARSGLDTEPFRLDRHPTMRHHPITPMHEADIREHLRMQTDLQVSLYDCLQLDAAQLGLPSAQPQLESEAILFDALYERHMPVLGSILQSMAEQGTSKFVLGSSGIENALTDYWVQTGRIDALRSHPPGRPRFAPAKQLLVITGSCSPVNDRQIAWAEQNGFATIALHPARLIAPDSCASEIETVVERALDCLGKGANLILHSARGPHDPRVGEALVAYAKLGYSELDIKLYSARTLGPKLGTILKSILAQHPVTRVGVAGGDTSGYVARELSITAFEAIAPVAPGSPLCRAYANNELDGIEFCFKGGQVGKDNYWGIMLHGTE